MQNAKNHRRFYPAHHFVLTPLLVALVVITLREVFNNEDSFEALIECLIVVSVLLLAFVSRIYALKNQDRIIRLEMRQRYFELTGRRFQEKEAQLRLGQIIALRFASDDELIPLIDRAINEKMPPKDIKNAIQHWQVDKRRV